MSTSETEWDQAEYKRALEERQALQERLHAADPLNVPLYVPVDGAEFPCEAYTAGWRDENP